jgi:hypothetical protein
VRDGFQSTSDHKLMEVHQESVPRVREECAKVWEDIAEVHRAEFQTARDTYICLSPADIESPDHSQRPPGLADRFGSYKPSVFAWKPPPRYDIGRKRITELLDALIGYAA